MLDLNYEVNDIFESDSNEISIYHKSKLAERQWLTPVGQPASYPTFARPPYLTTLELDKLKCSYTP